MMIIGREVPHLTLCCFLDELAPLRSLYILPGVPYNERLLLLVSFTVCPPARRGTTNDHSLLAEDAGEDKSFGVACSINFDECLAFVFLNSGVEAALLVVHLEVAKSCTDKLVLVLTDVQIDKSQRSRADHNATQGETENKSTVLHLEKKGPEHM